MTTNTLRDLFRSSTLLTAINAKLTAAGLATFANADGIRRRRYMLAFEPALPAIAAEVGPVQVVERHGALEIHYQAAVEMYLAIADGSADEAEDAAADYCDAVRAAVESVVAPSVELLICDEWDPRGTSFDQTSDHPPSRQLRVAFTAEFVLTQGDT